jgi:hypothetical protein
MIVNFPNIRIRHVEDKGFVIEIQRSLKWVHIISYYGMSDKPYYYSSYNSAMDDLLKEIKWKIIRDSIQEGLKN